MRRIIKIVIFKFTVYYLMLIYNINSCFLPETFHPTPGIFYLLLWKSAFLNFGGFFSNWLTSIKSNIFQEFHFWCSINLSWGHYRSHTKFGPDQFSRFDVYTNKKQTNTHTSKYIYISIYKFGLSVCLFVWVSVCLSVCLYPINVKTAEPIGPKFFVGHLGTPEKV